MKKLDEVIKGFEVCRDLKIECDRCPYGDMHSMDGERLKCIENGMYPDAIHYLKTYRENQQTYEEGNRKAEEAREQYLEAVKNCERAQNKYIKSKATYDEKLSDYISLRDAWAMEQENPALTWGELKTMEGKPVYLEQYWYPMEDESGVTEDEVEIDKYWAVIDNVQAKRIHFVGKNLNMGLAKSELDSSKHGGWQAYRKERE